MKIIYLGRLWGL